MHQTTRRTCAALLALGALAGCGSSTPSQVPVGSTVAQSGPSSSTQGGGPSTTTTASQGNSATSLVAGGGSTAP